MTENYPHFMKTKSTYPRNATNPQQNVDERQRKLPHSISQSNFLNQHPKKKIFRAKEKKHNNTAYFSGKMELRAQQSNMIEVSNKIKINL